MLTRTILLFCISVCFTTRVWASIDQCILNLEKLGKRLAKDNDTVTRAQQAAQLDRLITLALSSSNPGDHQKAKQAIRDLLGTDQINAEYYWGLLVKKFLPQEIQKTKLTDPFDTSRTLDPAITGHNVAYGTAIAPPELLKMITAIHYSDLLKDGDTYRRVAKDVTLWIKKMHAGSGSSMGRISYLAEMLGIPESQVKIGAKGTDLYFQVPDPRDPQKLFWISFAEAQLIQSIKMAERGEVGGIAFHDIVSSETEESVAAMWQRPSYFDPSRTYAEYVRDSRLLERSGQSFQSYVPTLDSAGKVSFNRMAPAGHALFGVEGIVAGFRDKMRPDSKGHSLISVIGNGEDLGSTPDPVMIGWMKKNQIPIAMLTTTKTRNDLKGGQIVIVKRPNGDVYVSIFEAAQAKAMGQTEYFEKLGLDIKVGDQISFFNTNVAMINYEAFSPKIKKLVAEIGEEAVLRIISPDLIENYKEQNDFDGVLRKYLQLEGAMGSTLLNLDRYWRNKYNEGLISFINIDTQHREKFFSPIKTPFDFFMQFHSDRFHFDHVDFRNFNWRPGEVPAVSLQDPTTKDKFYADTKTVLEAFRGSRILDLDKLKIEGQVSMRDMYLVGKVTVINRSGKLVNVPDLLRGRDDILKLHGDKVRLKNVIVTISETGEVSVEKDP